MRVITWNMRRATASSKAWAILNEYKPEIALLQEVSSIPDYILDNYDSSFQRAITKNNGKQKFGTVVLVNGKIKRNILLKSKFEWVNNEINRFSGNLLSCSVKPLHSPQINVISVYSPAWDIETSSYPIDEVEKVKLNQNNKMWLTEILWSGLKNEGLTNDLWIIGGDFNCSETFDYTFSSGNKEILDRMENLGLSECLRKFNGKLIPTFKNTLGGKIIHQMDHLFVTNPLYLSLENCSVGNKSIIFNNSISDHLPIIATYKNPQAILSKEIEEFLIRTKFIFAKTMPTIPHYYIVQENLSDNDKNLFDRFELFIKKNGYSKKFNTKKYTYYNIGKYKYWVIENILNRAVI